VSPSSIALVVKDLNMSGSATFNQDSTGTRGCRQKVPC
jgi:hypothetical protein